MRITQFPLQTLKEMPADAEIISHKLMLRAGLVRKLAAGLYSWLPLGLRVLRKVEAIVRKEMENAGALEVLLPAVQPAELWQESGRWLDYGPELLRFKDRHQREFCFGPTHEEVITDLARKEIRSYKQLPVTYFQIQTKFRDEIRPRFGVMRAREFIMKDAYSFHMDQASLQQTYDAMYAAYCRIFTHIGLDYRAVAADSGNIGGQVSHEFHIVASSGEDTIAFSDTSNYAANIELAAAPVPNEMRADPEQPIATVSTPNQHSIEKVCAFLQIPAQKCLKTLLVKGNAGQVVALVLRGDHQLNVVKAEKLENVAVPLGFADEAEVEAVAGCKPGSVGPVGLDIEIIADASAMVLSDFVCGANVEGKHLTGVNWGRDLRDATPADIRNVVAGDVSPDGEGHLTIARGIEVGHIFQLGKKYSQTMHAMPLDEQGHAIEMSMGCYGIGVSRIVAAAIEQNNDNRGIIWPLAIAPFEVVILPINQHKSIRLREAVEDLYHKLLKQNVQVLYDDRKVRPGVMFADMELIGIPHRLVFGERGLDAGKIEYKGRADADSEDIDLDQAVGFIMGKLQRR